MSVCAETVVRQRVAVVADDADNGRTGRDCYYHSWRYCFSVITSPFTCSVFMDAIYANADLCINCSFSLVSLCTRHYAEHHTCEQEHLENEDSLESRSPSSG